jgi:hypothetical protein
LCIHGYTTYHDIDHVYTRYIHGYSLAFWDQISQQARAAGFIQCAHVWRVWVIKSVLFHAPPWQLCQGKGCPQQAQHDCRQPPPLSLAAAVTVAAVAAVSRAASFSFPSLVAGSVLNGGESAFRAGDQCAKQLWCLPALKI